MSTTTIRLPPELKERVARAAERAGTTAHSFILEAIAEKTAQDERRGEFRDVAEQRFAETSATGKAIASSDMRVYLERRVKGEKKIKRPRPKSIAR